MLLEWAVSNNAAWRNFEVTPDKEGVLISSGKYLFSLGGRLSHATGHSKGYVPHKIIA